MTHDRDEVKADYMDATIAALGGEWGQLHTGHIVRSMAEEIVRLRSILAALREPSEAVISRAWEEIIVQCQLQTHDVANGRPLTDWMCYDVTEKEVPMFIRAAVAAPEQEATP